jgi:hypothetical protein
MAVKRKKWHFHGSTSAFFQLSKTISIQSLSLSRKKLIACSDEYINSLKRMTNVHRQQHGYRNPALSSFLAS